MSIVWVTDSGPEAPPTGKHLVTREWLQTLEREVGPPEVVRVRSGSGALRRLGLLAARLPGMWASTIGEWHHVARALDSGPSATKPSLAVVDHFRLAWTLPLLRRRFECPCALLAHNVEAQARASYVGRATAGEQLAALAELPALRRWEGRLSRAFDVVVTLTRTDARHFEAVYGCPQVLTIPPSLQQQPRIAGNRAAGNAAEKRRSLLYVGSFEYRAKRANARWFLSEVAPQLVARHPACEVVVVGHGSKRLRDHAWGRAPWLRIEGDVPDVRPFYDGAVAAVVPERVGGGFKTKVLEAVWNGVPVVGTTASLEPLSLKPGSQCIAVDTAEEWVAAAGSLLEDAACGTRIAGAALAAAERMYSRQLLEARIKDLLERVGRTG